jgi:hypothetical protein
MDLARFVAVIGFNFMDSKLNFDFGIELFTKIDFDYFADLSRYLKKNFIECRLLLIEFSFTLINSQLQWINFKKFKLFDS